MPPKKAPSPMPDLLMPKPVAVGYNRQSRARPEDVEAGRVVSTSLQNNQNKAWAFAHDWAYDDDLSLLASDINVSGARKEKDKRKGQASWRKRRGLMVLFEAAQQGRFQHLIVYKLSRLGRSAVEVNDICECFGALGVCIHVIDVNLSTGTTFGDLLLKILSAVAEMELETIREWAVESSLARAQAGKHHGPMPGWIEQDADGNYVIKESMADAIYDMVSARLRGLPYSQIARLLNEKQHARARGGYGGKWTAQEVGRLLTSEYRLRLQGTSIFGIDREENDPRRIINPDVFPAVLTPGQADELDAVQRELVTRAPKADNTGRGKGLPAQASKYLLTGLAMCGVCGARLESAGGRGQWRFYGCRAASDIPGAHPELSPEQTESDKRKRSRAYISAPSLEEAVVRAMGVALHTFGGLLAETPKSKPKNLLPPKPKRDPAALLVAEDALTDSFTSLVITKAQFGRQLTRINEDRAAWQAWEDAQHKDEDAQLGWVGLVQSTDSDTGLEPAEMKLAFRRVIDKVEYPVTFAGVRAGNVSKVDMPWVRITLKNPLPNGETVILSAVHQIRFTGPRRVVFGEGPPTNEPYRAGVKKPRTRPVENWKTPPWRTTAAAGTSSD